MTNQELFNKADKAMKDCYESGIRCLSTSESKRSAVFFRDFSQGQIDGIYEFTTHMYLELIYNRESENEKAEDTAYMRFCNQIRERANTLREDLIEYAVRYI